MALIGTNHLLEHVSIDGLRITGMVENHFSASELAHHLAVARAYLWSFVFEEETDYEAA
jgi:hypothetical protein